MTVIHAEPETVVLSDSQAEVGCFFAGCTVGAAWVGKYSVCGCRATYCDAHKAWWDDWLGLFHTLGCEVHVGPDQRFVDWRRL